MLVSDERKALFIHVQKTGGVTVQRSLEAALRDPRKIRGAGRHATLADVLAAEPELVDYWTFGFVRNPWARMVSWFGMGRRLAAKAAQGDERALRQQRNNPFLLSLSQDWEDFERFVHEAPESWERLRTPQVDYLTTPAKRADFIGRTERLAADLARIYEHLGLPVVQDPPRLNASEDAVDYRTFYSSETRRRVGDLFAADVEAFGYTF